MKKLNLEVLMAEFRRTGSYALAAQAAGISRHKARYLIMKTLSQDIVSQNTVFVADNGQTVVSSGQTIHTLDELLRVAQIDTAKWIVSAWTANKWDSPDGKELWQIKAHLERKPEWLNGVKEVSVAQLPKPVGNPGSKTVLTFGDAHFGFDWDFKKRTLIPYHDERALDIVLQVASEVKPDTIVLLGDMLDLTSWTTKFPRKPENRFTTQPALEAFHEWLVRLRMGNLTADIEYMEGNHEERIEKFLTLQADELLGLMGTEEEPLLSVPYLLKLSGLNIRYHKHDFWMDDLRFRHGDVVRKGGGATVAASVREATCHEVFGHIHRRELAYRSIPGRSGSYSVFSTSPGCLCRVDGIVPGSDPNADWQQGISLLTSFEDGTCSVENIPLDRGRAVFRGKMKSGCR